MEMRLLQGSTGVFPAESLSGKDEEGLPLPRMLN